MPAEVKPPRLTTPKVEMLIAAYFGMRTNIIVPNVSWGLINHEADLLVLRPSGWAEEVEIKVCKSDLKRDLLKHGGRGHRHSEKIHKLWFAVPEALASMPEIPADAGILSVSWSEVRKYYYVTLVRAPQLYKRAHKLTDDEVHQLMRLGMFRIWSLKQKNIEMRSCIDGLASRLKEQDGISRSKSPVQ